MSKSSHRNRKLCASFSIAALVLVSNLADAEIYKWRDHMGRTQYSDKPPVQTFTKIVKSEIVNAMQSKELCALPTSTATNTKSPTASLFNFSFFPQTTVKATSRPNVFDAPSFATRAPVQAQYSPLSAARTLSTRGRSVTVFGLPVPSSVGSIGRSIISNFGFSSRPASFTTSNPTTGVTPRATTPAPVVAAAPPLPVVSAAAVKVATAAPAPTNTSPTPSSAPNIVQTALMPAVDISKNIVPAAGAATQNIQAADPVNHLQEGSGAFRTSCNVSHMGNDDPIVFPNQPGAAHHHTFFGNTTANAATNIGNLSAAGNSTCAGGTLNRSAYWIPSMIDTRTNTPIKPGGMLAYYKSGAIVAGRDITAPPKGLRMISGDAKATSEQYGQSDFSCFNNATGAHLGGGKSIPVCGGGSFIRMHIAYPQCWDGVNLDSPNHKDHMAWALDGGTRLPNQCPASHPIPIPSIAMNIDFPVTDTSANWRLASDNYSTSQPGGYSIHCDWANGWDIATINKVVSNCLKTSIDCGVDNLGNNSALF